MTPCAILRLLAFNLGGEHIVEGDDDVHFVYEGARYRYYLRGDDVVLTQTEGSERGKAVTIASLCELQTAIDARARRS